MAKKYCNFEGQTSRPSSGRFHWKRSSSLPSMAFRQSKVYFSYCLVASVSSEQWLRLEIWGASFGDRTIFWSYIGRVNLMMTKGRL